ncbi:two-component system response regulator ResD [Hydrogenispora ethanolica]|jgi:DNA-binding response OmpR family regulator|uniref:Two-component system response regulator ResD n=1 Tax=Hydrogenispora ethanolica TaxID=1082276 RepID=A0A4V2QC22_HYDET|nr:response regulator transcription factor [Hydrogenispora ethanolica]TCL58637.1 two-component system response regulator ResD [Hydrogenispora ethanolica]
MIKILIADDQRDIREIVGWYLAREGFQVLEAADGDQALEMETLHTPDLLILDVMMPGLSGWEVAKAMARIVPVIFLTALGQEHEKLTGFNLGADDYVTKPFSPKELVARVLVALRRTGKLASSGVMRFPELTIEPGAQTITVRGEAVELSAKEFALLHLMARYPRTIFTREKLVANIWGYDFEGDDRTVDTTIKRVRHKLGAAGHYIVTVRGKGYKFEAEPE